VTKRAAFYIRVSTEKQAKEGYSLAEQRLALYQTAAARGYVLADGCEFVEAYSAKTADDRRQLGRMRAAAQRGEFDVVLTKHPNRWGRDLLDALIVRKELRDIDLPLEYVAIQPDDSPTGELLEQMLLAFAQHERTQILERTSAGRRQKAREGKMPSARAPYGYVRDRAAPCGLRIDDARGPDDARSRADWVRVIFGWLADGASLRTIRTRLMRQGCPSPGGGGAWAPATLQKLVHCEHYVGRAWYNRRKRGKGSSTFRDSTEWIAITTVPPIIEQSLFDRAQAQLRRHVGGKPATHVYLAGGLLMCGVCGRKLRGDVEGGSRRPGGPRAVELVYRCAGRHLDPEVDGVPPCRFRILARKVDRAVWNAVADEVRVKAKLRRLAPEVHRVDARTELADLERRAKTIAAQRDRLLDLHLTAPDRMDRARFDAKDRLLAAEAAQIEAERARVAALIASGEAVAEQQAAAVAHARLLVRNLDGLDERQRTELIHRWVTSVVVYPDLLDVRGLFPQSEPTAHDAPDTARELSTSR
jgi:site-specific DNA recombinase